jgi:short-subunit dehydrogenase
LFEVNFFATCRLLNAAAERMLSADQGGHLLACSSCVARFSVPYHAAYSATKASQDLYCQAMRVELKPRGIHVSTVHPISTTTDFFDVSASVSGRTHAPTSIEHTPRLFRQSPERVARGVVRCLHRPRPEVWTSRLVRFTSAVRGLWPTIMDRQFRRMLETDRLHRG